MSSVRVAIIIQVPKFTEPIKVLITRDKTVGELMMWLRVHIKMEPKQALFMLVGTGVLPANSATVGEIYDEHKAADGRLYIHTRIENTFG